MRIDEVRRKLIYGLTPLWMLLVAVFGCQTGTLPISSDDRYDYQSIQKEFAHLTCNLEPSSQNSPPSEPCVLEKPLSLADAIDIALRNNPSVNAAMARIKQAEAMIDQARAAYYPYLQFYTEYIQGNAPSSYLFKTIDQRQLPPQTDFNDPGWFQNYETGILAGINLYNGGKDRLNRKIANQNHTIHTLDRAGVDNALIVSVIHAYFNVQSACDYVRIAEESTQTVAAQLKVMDIRYRGGSVLKSDILSLEVHLAQAKEELVRSRSNRQTSLAAMAQVLGLNPDQTIRLVDEKLVKVDLPENYPDGVIHALEHRPELKKVREQLRQARMSLDLAQTGYFPRIDLFGRYYLDDPHLSYSLDRDNWDAGVMVKWDIFTGFTTRSEKDKALGILEEMMAADRQSTLAVKLDVKNAYLKLDEVSARLKVTEKSVAMAEESFELVKKQYEGGSADITRYLQAEFDLNRARVRRTTAYFDHEQAVADVGRAIGYWSTRYTKGSK